MHEIAHTTKALDLFCARAMAILDNEALTELAREVRPLAVKEWREWRERHAGSIAEFMATPSDQWTTRYPDRLSRTTLALAAWQLSQDLSILLGEIRVADEPLQRLDPGWIQSLASESVLSFLVAQRSASLWPGQLGSPFQP